MVGASVAQHTAQAPQVETIEPQEGFQSDFLSSAADIIIGGGSAGAGKTYALLLDPLRHIDVSDWGAVIFRRTNPQIRAEGGLWDTAMQLYPLLAAEPKETTTTWTFPSGAKFKFSHLEYEKNKLDWQGSQIPYIGFDELTHFSKSTFFYLLSRNRSMCGVKPMMRATCNPDPDSWVADFIEWWIDQETGFPIPERSGVVRYFMIDSGEYIWGDTVEEVVHFASHIIEPILDKTDVDPRELVKSLTFIPGTVYHNKKLIEKNPSYLSNLLAQDEQTKSQLLDGNWKVKVSEDELIDYYAFKDAFTNEFVEPGMEYIVADIALEGSDKFVISYWNGFRFEDIEIVDKSDGKKVIEDIRSMQKLYSIPNRRVLYDHDGVGGFVKGYLAGAHGFVAMSRPVKVKGEVENYDGLKAQCHYRMSKRINSNQVFFHPRVAEKMYDKQSTVRQRMMVERRSVKKYKPGHDGKLRVLPKIQSKALIGNTSPDIMDVIMMREYFELNKPKKRSRTRSAIV